MKYTNYVYIFLVSKTMAASLIYFKNSNKSEYVYDDYDDREFMEQILQSNSLDLQNPYINHQKYSYLINNEHICDNDVFVLSLVKSAPERYVQRKAIRNTWASMKSHDGVNIATVFIMGQYQNTNANLEKMLDEESDAFGDIIQGDFIENIRNQTYKSIMGLAWARTFCGNVDFVLTISDETMVDPFHLIDFLQQQQQINSENFLYCSTFFDTGPERSPGDNSFVTINEYPFDKYPPHCEGFAYIVSNDVMIKLLESAKSVSLFWLENVYVTGMLAAKAEVKHMDMTEEHAYNFMQPEHLINDIKNSMFLLAKYSSLRKNWDNAWKAIRNCHLKELL